MEQKEHHHRENLLLGYRKQGLVLLLWELAYGEGKTWRGRMQTIETEGCDECLLPNLLGMQNPDAEVRRVFVLFMSQSTKKDDVCIPCQ